RRRAASFPPARCAGACSSPAVRPTPRYRLGAVKVSDEHLPSIVERMRRYGLEDRLTFSYGHCVHEGEQRPVLLCWLDGVPLLQALLPADEVDDDTLARAHRKCINYAARKVAADAWTE